MFQQQTAPVAGSLALSALIALLPLVTIFVMLGVFRTKAHVAGLCALAVAFVVAVTAFRMPVGLAALSATQGVANGLFPIMWIVICAVWLYQLTVVSGRFDDLRAAFSLVSPDPRVQAVIVAFCFGALLEALAGFGAPVAITAVMLMAMGFSAIRAAAVCLLANTAPVAFGAIATPVITAGTLTKIDYNQIGAMVGRQTPLLAFVVPLLLVMLVDGLRGLRQTWPFALVVGVAFGIAQFLSANYFSVELTDVVASLTGLVVAVVFLRFWQPGGTGEALHSLEMEHQDEVASVVASGDVDGAADGTAGGAGTATSAAGAGVGTLRRPPSANAPDRGRILMGVAPYLLVIVVFWLAKKWGPLVTFLTGTDRKIPWPGLDGQISTAAGKVSTSTVYNFPWLSSPGTLLLLCGLLVLVLYRVSPVTAAAEFGRLLVKMRWAILTVASVLALAYEMNFSGQTLTIGKWIAAAGSAFAFLSPILGWLGVALTGSDTSSNALFATMQVAAAKGTGLDPTLLVAANSSGGVMGKMISPQNLTIAATAVGMIGKEAEILRRVLLWSLGLLLVLCVLVYLQSTAVLSWMVVG
ncbi:MAG TPA: L-lactate permease [Kineosporiaceae bacterium]|nr:L-lactate permease [Kineosporiaceae bacterium]